MATLTNAGNVYDLTATSGGTGVGQHNAEDVGDFITNISPTETPFISNIGRTNATGVIHEFLSHSLAAADPAAVWIEGTEATLTQPTEITRDSNYCQINARAVAVSGTQDRVKKYGMGRELAYRVLLHTKEIKRDMEAAALQNTSADASGGSTTAARRIKGVPAFVTTNMQGTSGAPVALSQSNLDTLLQDIWTEGGNPDTMIVDADNKRTISGFAPSGVAKNLDATDKKLVTAVDIYESDFGVLNVVPDRFTLANTVYALEMDLWKLATLRPLEISPLAKTGDTTKRQILVEWTLECRAENGNGVYWTT